VLDTFDGVKTGGVLSARRFVEALRRRHEVTVLAAGPAGPGREPLPGFYPPLFARVMREMGFVFAVPRRAVIERVLRRADVVHLQFPFWLGMRTAALARPAGVPVVAGFHVQPENMLRNIGLGGPRASGLVERTYRLFLRRYFALADTVVCPSAFALGLLRDRGLAVPAEVISNGIPPELAPLHSPGADLGPLRPPRPGRGDGPFLLLAVGRLAREKRLDVVVEGVRRSRHAPRIRLVITGRGPEERRIRARAATLPRPAEIGFVSDEALRDLLRSADLLLHASEVELEGMAVLEALGCGTPALIADSATSAAPQLAVSPELLFRAGDADDLARRLDALLDQPERLAEARARCPALARSHRFEDSVERLEALYARLARRGPAAAPRRTVA
jgi:glycosyltransferase involved in cell wall biosynthesis